jgi:hypothetical protein
MQIDSSRLDQYLSNIWMLPCNRELLRSELLISELRLYQERNLEIYYVPFDYLKPDAKLLVLGITPGWTQMELAYRFFRNALEQNKTWVEIYSDIEKSASFAGSMRMNLVSMLDELQVPSHLGIASSAFLFGEHHHLIHTTSAIRYAVFVNGENYTGHNPKILNHSKLREFVDTILIEELTQVPDALIIPQGKAVSEVLMYLIRKGQLKAERCLLNFPHASGANGHRKKQFSASRTIMEEQISKWFQQHIS